MAIIIVESPKPIKVGLVVGVVLEVRQRRGWSGIIHLTKQTEVQLNMIERIRGLKTWWIKFFIFTVKALHFAGIIFCGFPNERYFVGI